MLDKKDVEYIINDLLKTTNFIKKYDELIKLGRIKELIQNVSVDRNFVPYFFAVLRNLQINFNGNNIFIIAQSIDMALLRAIIISYIIFSKLPKNRFIVTISAIKLVELNTKILIDWDKILEIIGKKSYKNLSFCAYSFFGIILFEMVFKKFAKQLNEIVALYDINYSEIFYNLYGIEIFDIICKFADFDTKRDGEIIFALNTLLTYHFSKSEFENTNLNKIYSYKNKIDVKTILEFMKVLK